MSGLDFQQDNLGIRSCAQNAAAIAGCDAGHRSAVNLLRAVVAGIAVIVRKVVPANDLGIRPGGIATKGGVGCVNAVIDNGNGDVTARKIGLMDLSDTSQVMRLHIHFLQDRDGLDKFDISHRGQFENRFQIG